jgi:short-subunit dehydrogenase
MDCRIKFCDQLEVIFVLIWNLLEALYIAPLHLQILQAFLPSMQRRRHGHIVMLTSVAGLTGINNLVPLSTAQFAVQGLAESLIEELRNYKPSGDVKLTLVHIYPFIVDKEMSTNIQLR